MPWSRPGANARLAVAEAGYRPDPSIAGPLAHIGHPIVGDPKYFDIENWHLPGGMQDRLHLLARRIVVPHPRGGVIDASAPLPPHMQQTGICSALTGPLRPDRGRAGGGYGFLCAPIGP